MSTIRWNLLGCSFLALLLSAYLDNMRGPLLPYFSRALERPYSDISWFLALGNFAAVITNLALIRLVGSWGTPRVAKAIWGFALFVVILGFQVESFRGLMGWGVVLGSAVAALGAICNLLVIRGTDPAHRSQAFSGLHVMYGLGSFLAPLSVAWVFSRSFAWYGVLWAALIGLMIWIGLLSRSVDGNFKPPANLDRFVPDRGVMWILGAFTCYVVGEVTVSTWLSAYLVETRGLSIPEATPYLTGFFLCMMTTRLLFSLGLGVAREIAVVWGTLLGALVFLGLGLRGWNWGFALAGVFGPVYPILLSRMSRRYGYHSERITLWIMMSTQLGLCFSQSLMGRFTDQFGIYRSYWLSPIMLSLAAFAIYFYLRSERVSLRGA